MNSLKKNSFRNTILFLVDIKHFDQFLIMLQNIKDWFLAIQSFIFSLKPNCVLALFLRPLHFQFLEVYPIVCDQETVRKAFEKLCGKILDPRAKKDYAHA